MDSSLLKSRLLAQDLMLCLSNYCLALSKLHITLTEVFQVTITLLSARELCQETRVSYIMFSPCDSHALSRHKVLLEADRAHLPVWSYGWC